MLWSALSCFSLRKLDDLELESFVDNKSERMGHLYNLVEMRAVNVVEDIHMKERDVIEVKEEIDIVEILENAKTQKFCEESSPMSSTDASRY